MVTDFPAELPMSAGLGPRWPTTYHSLSELESQLVFPAVRTPSPEGLYPPTRIPVIPYHNYINNLTIWYMNGPTIMA